MHIYIMASCLLLCVYVNALPLPMCMQKFIRQPGVPVETAARVYRRYLKLEPEHAEEYITYLKAKASVTVHTCAGLAGAHTGLAGGIK